jgi:hypothetical protein
MNNRLFCLSSCTLFCCITFSSASVLAQTVQSTIPDPNRQLKSESFWEKEFPVIFIDKNFETDLDNRLTSTAMSDSPAPTTTLQAQVTSVTQLSDVQPTDWAFGALQSLIERYGVVAGYPNGTFKGNRALTRYEFAASLNAVNERIKELLVNGSINAVSPADLDIIRRLQVDFSAELATLRNRIDELDLLTTELESNQFSTTTQLQGQVIFAINDGEFDGDRLLSPTGVEITDSDPNTTFLYRVTLDFDTSFTGDDLLKLRVDTGSNGANDNAAGVLEPNFGSILDYSVKPPRSGDFGISRLYYSFKPFEDFTVSLGPNIRTFDYVDRNSYANLSFRDFSTQALVNNFILLPLNGPTAGAFIEWNPGAGDFTIRALYAAGDAENASNEPTPISGAASFSRVLYPNSVSDFSSLGERGLFGATYQGFVEFEYAPFEDVALRLQYAGGEIFDNRFDGIGANIEWRISPQVALFGRYGFSTYDNTVFGDIDPNYWMAGIAFPDLFKQGAIAGIAAGQPFIVTEIGDATQTNFEAFYNFPVNDNIRITPTIQVITNPANQNTNGTIVTGTLRTVFSF